MEYTLFPDELSSLCCPVSIPLSYDYVSRSARSYLWLQCDVHVSDELSTTSSPLYPVCLTEAIHDSYELSVSQEPTTSKLTMCPMNCLWLRRTTILCLQWYITVGNALSMSLKSYLFSSKLSVSLVSYLFSSELSVSPISFLCLQWAV